MDWILDEIRQLLLILSGVIMVLRLGKKMSSILKSMRKYPGYF